MKKRKTRGKTSGKRRARARRARPRQNARRRVRLYTLARRVRRPRRKRNPALLVLRNPLGNRTKVHPTAEQLREWAKKDKEFARALRRFRSFHGGDPDSIELVEVPGVQPKFRWAVTLGETRAHEYQVPSSSARSPGPPFRHSFKRGRQLTITDPDGKVMLVAKRKGSRLRVTARGIED